MNSNEQNININSDLLITEQLPDKLWTWTLASRLSDMLYLAEDLFGPRDPSYTPLGIEFVSDGPKVWFPGKPEENRNHIIIRLNLNAVTDTLRACYQLAHESVHLLTPVRGNTNYLEEGVATYFSTYYMEKKMNQPPGYWKPTDKEQSYKEALEKVSPLFNKDEYWIRKLRSEQPEFTKITEEQISSVLPDLLTGDIKFLLSEFNTKRRKSNE